MRRLLLSFIISFGIFTSLSVQTTYAVGRTCCENPGTDSQGNALPVDPLKCRACSTDIYYKNEGDDCGGDPTCQTCSGSHPVANGCSGGGSPGFCQAEFKDMAGNRLTSIRLTGPNATQRVKLAAGGQGSFNGATVSYDYGVTASPRNFGSNRDTWETVVKAVYPGRGKISFDVDMGGATPSCTAEIPFVVDYNICQAQCDSALDCNAHEVRIVNVRKDDRRRLEFDYVDEYGVKRESNAGGGKMGGGFVYSPDHWSSASNSKYSGSNARTTITNGAAATFLTNAGALSLVMSTGPNMSSYNVLVDGQLVQNVDLYAPVAGTSVQTISIGSQTTRSRTVRVVTNDSSSNLRDFALDSVRDAGGSIEDGSSRLALSGTAGWQTRSGGSGTYALYSARPNRGGQVQFTTTSPYIVLRAGKNNRAANRVEVYVDNRLYTTLNLNTSSTALSFQDYQINIDEGSNAYTCHYPNPASGNGQCRSVNGGACPLPPTPTPTPTPSLPPTPTPTPPATPTPPPPTPGTAWFQTRGGDVGAGNKGFDRAISNTISQTCREPLCSPYLLATLGGRDTSIGALIHTKDAYVTLSQTSGNQTPFIGPQNFRRRAPLPVPPVCRENYDYFYRLYSMGQSPRSDFASPQNATKPNPGTLPLDGRSAYFYEGPVDFTITTPWSVSLGESIVIFIDGNLRIENDIKVQEGGFLAFIVSGNIIVGENVGTDVKTSITDGQVQGVYIANGTFEVKSVGPAGTEHKFVGEGTFVACQDMVFPRNFSNGGTPADNVNPATVFIYRPDLILNVPNRMKTTHMNWQEVAP